MPCPIITTGDLPYALDGVCADFNECRSWSPTTSSKDLNGSGLEIKELVGDFFGGERVEHGHDPSGEFEVRGAAVGDENACMASLFAERSLVQLFKVASIMGQDCSLVCSRKVQLCGVGIPEVLRFSGGQDIKSVRM